jgi:hypothetical protein
MHLVTHTCGQQLWRQETGGVQRIVTYSADGQREIHECPNCGANLGDRDLVDTDGQALWRAEAEK